MAYLHVLHISTCTYQKAQSLSLCCLQKVMHKVTQHSYREHSAKPPNIDARKGTGLSS